MDKISDLLNSDIPMQPRVERLNKLLGNSLYESLLWGDDYSTELIDEALKRRIRTGHFQRLVFYGMGCSSVVSDVMKAFLIEEKLPLEVEVVNDYSFEWFTSPERLCSDTTLSIIVCYSGWSVEPILFYEKMKEMTGNRNLIVFSAGGKIASIAKKDGVALVQYRLRHADREYPLYHVQQFFSVFVNFFYDLGLLNSNYQAELEDTVSFLKSEFNRSKIIEAKEIADKFVGARIAFLATAKWYTALLKQTTMFFNEIAMVPSHSNLLHEFTHTEVAAYSAPTQKQALVVLLDSIDDRYTRDKVATMEQIFSNEADLANKNIVFLRIDLDQPDFLKKFFYTHFFMVYIAYFLAQQTNILGRDLISLTAKNPWWSQKNIDKYESCIDIPSEL